MTYGEVKKEALKLLDKYSVAGDIVSPSYNNQADYLARIPGLVNDALTYICTAVKRIPAEAMIIRDDCDELGGMYQYSFPSDFWQIQSGGMLVVKNGEVSRFTGYIQIGNKKILFPKTLEGSLLFEYYRYPDQVDLTAPEDDYYLDCGLDIQTAIPYYVAAHLALQEDAFQYSTLYNEFETRLSRLTEGVRTESRSADDVYTEPWGDFYG